MNIPKINFYVASPEKAAEFIFSLKESLGEDENDAEEKMPEEVAIPQLELGVNKWLDLTNLSKL